MKHQITVVQMLLSSQNVDLSIMVAPVPSLNDVVYELPPGVTPTQSLDRRSDEGSSGEPVDNETPNKPTARRPADLFSHNVCASSFANHFV
jgi:hypothetical protein